MNNLENILGRARNLANSTRNYVSNIANTASKYTHAVADTLARNSKSALLATALAASSLTGTQKADAAIQNGFLTWDSTKNGGTNLTVNSGDFLDLYIIQSTTNGTSGVWYDKINLSFGPLNSLTNNFKIIDVDYFNKPDGTVTNGFYNGRTLDMNPLVTNFQTNSTYFQANLYLNSITGTSSTGDLVKIKIQAMNDGPTEIFGALQLGSVQLGRGGSSTLTWGSPNTWSLKSTDYGDSAYAYITIRPIPEPSTLILAVGGLLGSLALRRPKKAKK